LSRDAGRSWRGVLAYKRGISLVDGIAEPFFSDAINADVTGRVRRWLELTSGAAVAAGDVGLVSASTSFETWSATTRMRAALSRTRSVFAEYAIYRYVFGSGVTLPVGVPRHVERQSFRVGFAVLLPLVK